MGHDLLPTKTDIVMKNNNHSDAKATIRLYSVQYQQVANTAAISPSYQSITSKQAHMAIDLSSSNDLKAVSFAIDVFANQ